MPLTITNSLTRKKEAFEPLEKGKVKMYVCGPTVYDLLHIGNFRGAIFFNLVRNWLEASGYEVSFVYNYTDIDDKIINRANEAGEDPLELSKRYIEEFEKDYARLQIPGHTHNPKCTDHINDMVSFVEDLIKQEKAYEIEGSVFYEIAKFDSYGKLSGKKIDELNAGHRVDPDERKRNPLDFILWKPAKEDEPSWDSPWGKGRPGWHLECSCMSEKILGEQIDIHGGGIDLIFPHHENEIAQSEGKTNQPFAKYWMHNNFIQFDDEKMSKSLGNVIKARDFMDQYHPELLKYMILSVHYRSLLNFTKVNLENGMHALSRIYQAIAIAEEVSRAEVADIEVDQGFQNEIQKCERIVQESIDDDFNTPAAFAGIFDLVRGFNTVYKKGSKVKSHHQAKAKVFLETVKKYGSLLGLFAEEPVQFLEELKQIAIKEKNIDPAKVDDLIQQRTEARQSKDYERSDQIRDELEALGVEIQDATDGTTWSVSFKDEQ